MDSIKEGKLVKFLPEYENVENEFVYILIEDPDGGRVKVMHFNSGMEIPFILTKQGQGHWIFDNAAKSI